jgi:hypothetical protein
MEIECSSKIMQALVYKQDAIIKERDDEILSLKKRLAEAEAEAAEAAKSAEETVASAQIAVATATKRMRMLEPVSLSEYAYPYALDSSFLSYFAESYSPPSLRSPPGIKRLSFDF